MESGQLVEGSLYFYAPNKGAPVFFAAAFALSGLFHFWQCFHYKSFKITALHPITCLLFVVGFVLREYGAFHYGDLDIYIASTIFIYMAPPLLELANYHVIGRILYYVPYCSPIHPGRTLTTFGMLSTVVEVLNGIGVAWLANRALPTSYHNVGQALLKTSLLVQIAVILLFFILASIFPYRCAKAGHQIDRVRKPLLTLYISTMLILVRCIYRTVEYFSIPGADTDDTTISPIARYEWYFYIFEASLMLVNSILWNICHPRRYLPENYHTYLALDGITELEGPGWTDERSFIVTLVDLFGMFTRESREKPFWETDAVARM